MLLYTPIFQDGTRKYPQSSLPEVKEVREAFLYFTGAGITNASINGVSMDGAWIL